MVFWHIDTRIDCSGPYCIPVPQAISAVGKTPRLSDSAQQNTTVKGITETSDAHSFTCSEFFTWAGCLLGGGRSWRRLWPQTFWICHRERMGRDASFYPVQTGMSDFMWVELTEDSLTLWQLREHNVRLKPRRKFHPSLLRVGQRVCNE